MLGKAVELMIIAGMTNHVYRFNNKIRVQINGGPIGLSLTGEVAECYMVDWDTRFMVQLRKYNILVLLYSRFKDDIIMATKRIANGTKLVDGKFTIDSEKVIEDKEKSGSKVTFEVIRELAENIDPMIKFTIDTPCKYDDRKLPALDIKVQINPKENSRLDFEFYEKPTKHPKVILHNLALSGS